MSYTDAEWEDVLAFLNDEAEKAPPDGIGKSIETTEDFITVLRTVEAIKVSIVNSNANEAREFAKLNRDKTAHEQAVVDAQALIDAHPGNPNRRP